MQFGDFPTPRVMSTQAFVELFDVAEGYVFTTDLVQMWAIAVYYDPDTDKEKVNVAVQELSGHSMTDVSVWMCAETFLELTPLATLLDIPTDAKNIDESELEWIETAPEIEEGKAPVPVTPYEAYDLYLAWSNGRRPFDETIDLLLRAAPDVPSESAESYLKILKMLQRRHVPSGAFVQVAALCRDLANVILNAS